MTTPEQRQILAKREKGSSFKHYQDDPAGFVRDILQEYVWDKLEEVMLAVRDHPFVAVTGANAVGKGWVAARTVLWWLNSFAPSKIVTTAAPPARQVRELLWAEVRGAQRAALDRNIPLCGGKPGVLAIRTEDPHHWAQGFVIPTMGTPEERISRFQGHHSPHLLIVFDEAHGIPEEIFDAADSCLSGGHNHFLLLSNPLAPSGPFYRRTKSKMWHTIQISAFDHPNVISGKELVPGAVTRKKTYVRIHEGSRTLRWDEDVDELAKQAVFEVPAYFRDEDEENPNLEAIAGTTRVVVTPALATKVLGRFPLQADNALISVEWLEAAKQRWLTYVEEFGETPPPLPAGTVAVHGFDVAEFGKDPNVLVSRYEWFVTRPRKWNGVDALVAGDIAMSHLDPDDLVHVDGIGVGAGTGPHMQRHGFKKAYNVKFSASATLAVKQITTDQAEDMLPAEEFDRMRSQAYWTLREWLRLNPRAALPPDDNLEEDLTVLTYEKLPNGKLQVLPKKKVKELLTRSPNDGDAVALTFATGGPVWRALKFLKLSLRHG